MSLCDLCNHTKNTCACVTAYHSNSFYSNTPVVGDSKYDVLNEQVEIALKVLSADYSKSSKEDLITAMRRARNSITQLKRK